MLRFILVYLPAIAWSICISVLLLLPSSSFEGAPYFDGIDKLVHCCIFFVLTTLIYFGNSIYYKGKVNKYLSLVFVCFIVVGFAFLTEEAQGYLTETRSSDMWDIMADLVGIGLAMFAYVVLYRDVKVIK